MADSLPGKIGNYEVLSVLGRGGMGVVYRALDPAIGRQVAIKTITEDFTRDPVMLRRFQSEAEKTGMLMHPNIVMVYHLGSHEGYPYIVMEYIEGDSLDRLIKANHPFPLLYKLKIIEQICAALAYAHDHNVVHRDVKPANVIVQPDGNAKLVDFGIARQEKRDRDLRLTLTGSIIGTVPYMAPERLKGETLDGRSDIFAVGVMLFQLLTGRLPFEGEEMALVQKLLFAPHPPLSTHLQDYPAPLETILDRALAKDPYQRYATADEMAADLGVVIQELTIGKVATMLTDAQRAIDTSQHTAARKLLQQVVKLEGKNKKARAMLAEVQEILGQRQRMEQAEACRVEARQAMDSRNFESALTLLERAERLMPGDAGIGSLIEQARNGKRLQEQVDGYIRQADAARQDGNLASARSIFEKALKLDQSNSRLRSAYNQLIRQAEDSVRQAKMMHLIESTRSLLNLRQFGEAGGALKNAEEIDPLHVDLIGLRAAIDAGLREEQRRRVVEEVERQVHGVTTAEDAQRVAAVVARALDTLPYDSALLRLQVELKQQQQEHQERALLENTVRQCRAQLDLGASHEALATVRQALAILADNTQLTRLEASIEVQIAHAACEQRRSQYLADARDAIARGDFTAAIPLLKACQAEGPSDDTARMLQYAQEQVNAQRRNDLFARHAPPAQSLLREEEYAAAIQMIEHALFELDEPRLRALLEKARALEAEQQQKADQAYTLLLKTVEDEDCERGIALLDSLPQRMCTASRFAAVRTQLEQDAENEWVQLQFLGCSYATKAATGKPLAGKELSRRMLLSKRSKLLSHMFQFFNQ